MRKGFVELIMQVIITIVIVAILLAIDTHEEKIYEKGEYIKIYGYRVSNKPVNDNGGYIIFYTSAGKLTEGLGFDAHGNWKIIDKAVKEKQPVLCKARIYRPPFYTFKPNELRDIWNCKIEKY